MLSESVCHSITHSTNTQRAVLGQALLSALVMKDYQGMVGDLEEARETSGGRPCGSFPRFVSPPSMMKRGDVGLSHHSLRTRKLDAPGRHGIRRPGKHSPVCGREHDYLYFKEQILFYFIHLFIYF